MFMRWLNHLRLQVMIHPVMTTIMTPCLPWFMTPSISLKFLILLTLLSFFLPTSPPSTRTPNTLLKFMDNSFPEPRNQPPNSSTGAPMVVYPDVTCVSFKKQPARLTVLVPIDLDSEQSLVLITKLSC